MQLAAAFQGAGVADVHQLRGERDGSSGGFDVIAEKFSCHNQGAGIFPSQRRTPEFQDFRSQLFKQKCATNHRRNAKRGAHGLQQLRRIACRLKGGRGFSLTPGRWAAAGVCADFQCFSATRGGI